LFSFLVFRWKQTENWRFNLLDLDSDILRNAENEFQLNINYESIRYFGNSEISTLKMVRFFFFNALFFFGYVCLFEKEIEQRK